MLSETTAFERNAERLERNAANLESNVAPLECILSIELGKLSFHSLSSESAFLKGGTSYFQSFSFRSLYTKLELQCCNGLLLCCEDLPLS